MKSAEGRGRTLDEAVDAALIELGESRRNVDVRVISETAGETVVEVSVIDHEAAPAIGAAAPNGKAETARSLVEGLLKHMGVRAQQSVTNVMLGRQLAEGERVIVDVERYRQRREHTVREIALRAARQVKMTGDAITLDAMQAFERRAIHLALESDPDVTSSSIGEDPDRRVVVGPRKPAGS